MRKVAVVAASLLLCSCGLIEGLGLVPRVRVSIPVTQDLTNEQLLTCVEQSVEKTRAMSVGWSFSTKTTLSNVEKGVFETGDFGESNVAGLRVKAVIAGKPRFIELTLKGAGPYYSDLHVDQVMMTLKEQVRQCANA